MLESNLNLSDHITAGLSVLCSYSPMTAIHLTSTEIFICEISGCIWMSLIGPQKGHKLALAPIVTFHQFDSAQPQITTTVSQVISRGKKSQCCWKTLVWCLTRFDQLY